MKTKILLLAIAILGSGLLFSQTNGDDNSTKCDKKVLKKIERKMRSISMNDYLNEGEKTHFIVRCTVNEDKVVEATILSGKNDGLKQAVIDVLEKYPVNCDDMAVGSSFTFVMKFLLMPA